jgi:hypothetical protein
MRSEMDEIEHRCDRPYDDEDPSRILHPNRTRAVCSDREVTAAMVLCAVSGAGGS